ncbi:MAG: hypothetical protein R2853_03240 [Thermomicrobiales bacterium]
MQERATSENPDSLNTFWTRRCLARMLGGAAALGAMAAVVSSDEAAAKKRKKRQKRASPGPQGPVGPAGPAGPVGPQGAPVTFVTVTGERSAPLAAAVNSEVEAIAACGPNSVPVNCGWHYAGSAAELDRTITQVTPSFFRGEGRCQVTLRRTAAAGAAGGQVIATAICTR